jgi:hypothetical protein
MIQRNNEPSEAAFSVGLNIILTGSKKMTPEEQEKLMAVGSVRVLITANDDPESVLVDVVLQAKEFSTGSVGYGLQERGLKFRKGEK